MTDVPVPGIMHLPGQPRFLNPAMMAFNAFEIEIPEEVLAPLQDFAPQLQQMDEPYTVGPLANGLTLFNDRPTEWSSDICWLSHDDEATYSWFKAIYDRLGLARMVAPFVPHDRVIRLYAGFFVTRSTCHALNMHYDWLTEDNLAFTMMTPITANAGDLGLTYRTLHDEQRTYTYRLGTGIVFGSKFLHSTAIGDLNERAVFLCMNFGTDRMEHWPELSRTAGDQGDLFCRPDGRLVRRHDQHRTDNNSAGY